MPIALGGMNSPAIRRIIADDRIRVRLARTRAVEQIRLRYEPTRHKKPSVGFRFV
jgi:hypothetical protein